VTAGGQTLVQFAASDGTRAKVTSGGCARAQATYALTQPQERSALIKGHFSGYIILPSPFLRMAVFNSGNDDVYGLCSTDANVANGDSLTVTETVTISLIPIVLLTTRITGTGTD